MNVNSFHAFLFHLKMMGLYILRMFLKQGDIYFLLVFVDGFDEMENIESANGIFLYIFISLFACLCFAAFVAEINGLERPCVKKTIPSFPRDMEKNWSSKGTRLRLYSRYFYIVQFKISHRSCNYPNEEFFFLKRNFSTKIY